MAIATPSKSFLLAKAGPLPTWGWFAIGLGGALAYAYYKNHKAQLAGANAATNTTPGYTLPNNIQPQMTTVNEQSYSTAIGSNNQSAYSYSPTQNNLSQQTSNSTTLNQNGSGNTAAVTASNQPPAAGTVTPSGPPANTPPPPPASSIPPPHQIPYTTAWHQSGGGIWQPQTYGYAASGGASQNQTPAGPAQGQNNGGGGYGPGGARSNTYGRYR